MNKNFETRKKQEKGFILIMAYLLMTALSVFSLGLFSRGNIFLKTADRNKKKIMAFNAAEAGFDDAFYRVKNSTISSFPWSSGYVSMSSGSFEGGYSAVVTDMGSKIRKITVTGYSPDATTTTESIDARPITGYVQPEPSNPFSFGVFAIDSINFNGSNAKVDSYNSSIGSYATTSGTNGDIGTDGSAAKVIDLGNATVSGDAVVGPGGDTKTAITGNKGTVSGTESVATAKQNPPTPSADGLTSSGSIKQTKGTLTLPAGTYLYDSISISGKGQITATGAVTIYVTGSVDIGGNGIVTSSSSPPNMLIYVTGKEDVKFSGNGKLYAGVYAPNSSVKNTGGAEVFGSVVAKTYTQNGDGDMHFDEAMKDIEMEGSDELNVLSWQENNITAQSTSSSTTLNTE